jgi:autotransporter-associated beta strand protein
VIGGAGAVALDAANTYYGGTTISGGTLELGNIAAAGVGDISFNGAGLTLQIDAAGALANQIDGFGVGDTIRIAALSAGDSYSVSDSGATVTITSADGKSSETLTFDAGAPLDQIQFSADSPGGFDTLTICFMAGTMIATPEGEAAVETLKRGDLVLTAMGDVRPVAWLGRQTVAARFADPVRNFPIRIKACALSENIPSRDLLVSPDHALLVEDVLVHAGALVNGTTIVRETIVPETFIYYHVELDDHSLILAENVPAETFIDNVDRMNFDNWAEHEALYPDGKPIEDMPFPRAKGRRQVPMHIRAALEARAKAICAEKILAVA